MVLLDICGTAVLWSGIGTIFLPVPGNIDLPLLLGLCGALLGWSLAAAFGWVYGQAVLLGGHGTFLLGVAKACGLALGVSCVFAAVSGHEIVAPWFWICVSAPLVWAMVVRVLFRWRLVVRQRGGACVERALLLTGSVPAAIRAEQELEIERQGQIRIVGRALLPGLVTAPSGALIVEAVRRDQVDRVYLVDFDDWRSEVRQLIGELSQLAVDVTLLVDVGDLASLPICGAPAKTLRMIDVARKPMTDFQVMTKRALDLILCVILLLITAPVFAATAIAIKWNSPGPVFFRQVRLGFHDSRFNIWKFRTMYHDDRQGGALRQTGRNDNRVTPIGRLLRKTSVDELPQLINVLLGEMSIVGPRPHAESMTTAGLPLHNVVEGYAARHRVKPGITGWAQIGGCRGEVQTIEKLHKRVAMDCHYIENWSVALDIWIILCTVRLLIFDTDAY